MSSPIRPPLTVKTIDGTTEGRPINTIRVTNGDLSISGTVATIDTSGSGGSGTVTSVGTSQAFITITDPTTTPSISIGNASGAATGVLTAANFNTFDAKQDAITLTTTGTSGASTFAGGTLNIPQYTDSGGTVTSVGTSQAFITITDPTTTPSISIGNASGAATGVLTATDWNTFNSKGSGTIGGSSTANQISFGDTTANEITSTGNFQFLSGQNLYVAGRIQIGNATGTKLTTVSSQNLILDTNEGTDSGSIVIEAGTNGQISITPDGSGLVKIDGVGINNSAIATGYIFKATSATEAGWVAESGGGIGGSITDNQVAVGATTADEIEGSSDFTFDSNILKIGGASGSATFTSGGTGFTKVGVNSGSSSEPFIFLSSGTSGNLQLNAGGTGTASPVGVVQVGQTNMGVEISRAYTLPKVVTTTNDYVLTAQTDGSTAWAAAGGGGGGGIGGSITDNQVAVGATTTDDIEGSAGFTYDSSTRSLNIAAGTGTGTILSGSSDMVIRNSSATAHSKITLGYDAGNSNIKLDTDGTGLVEIHKEGSLAYSLPDVVTAADDYVLTANTDGSTAWAASGGSNNTPGIPTGNTDLYQEWLGFGGGSGLVSSGANNTVNAQWANGSTRIRPHVISKTGTLGVAAINVTILPLTAAAQEVKIGLYKADTDGGPGDLKAVATISVSASTGVLTGAYVAEAGETLSVTRGELYWAAFYSTYASSSDAMTVSMNATNALPSMRLDLDTSPRATQTYYSSGELPEPFTVGANPGDSSGQTWLMMGTTIT